MIALAESEQIQDADTSHLIISKIRSNVVFGLSSFMVFYTTGPSLSIYITYVAEN